MPHIELAAAEALAARILQAHGAPVDIAADVAAHLVLADRSGHASHGLSILPGYLDAVRDGLLMPAARPTVLRDSGALLMFDGHRGYGQHAGRITVERAIARARAEGSCLLTLRNSYHLGRAGHYGEMAAAAGLVFLSFLNVVGRQPMVAPFGGGQARLSTNPLCFAAPLGAGEAPFVLDYATSGIAANKVRLMAASHTPVPPGLLIDSHGQPTQDANALLGDPPGALLPFGAHKGYALGFFAELLAGVLSGGGTIAPAHARDGGLRNNLFGIVIDPSLFGDVRAHADEAEAFADYVRDCPAQEPDAPVRVPGEPEARHQQESAESVELAPAAWALFAACAQAEGLDAEAQRCITQAAI